MTRDGMPRAYLRIDPNLDQTHPDVAAFVALLCAAARQPDRGRFRDRAVLDRSVGRSKVTRLLARGDVVMLADQRLYVAGWDEWQEGDHTVSERMRRMRARRARPDEDGNVTRSPRQRTADWRTRTSLFERDEFTCRYCGAFDYPRDLLVAEHVEPDGPGILENLVTACRPCNIRKGARTPEEAGMVLHEIGYRSTEPTGDTPRVTRPRGSS